jgi:hypothetical protein
MAVLGVNNPTLLDIIKATDPDGSIADVVEALDEQNPILKDMTFKEGNLPTGERVTIRSGLPNISWRAYNEGIANSKSTRIQVDEGVGMLNGRSSVDVSEARLNGNEAAFRASEDTAFVSSFDITVSDAIFYSNVATAPKQFHGLAPRFNTLSLANVIDYNDYDSNMSPAGDDSRSIWFVTWHPQTCYGIFPKGSKAGLIETDMGKQLVLDSGGTNSYLAWVTDYEWQLGLVVKDWRYIVRIANIDSSAVTIQHATLAGPFIELAMIEAHNRIFNLNVGRTVCYMDRAIKTALEQQTALKTTMNFTPVDWHGKQVMGFRGTPIVICDALATDEAPLT